MKTLKGESWSNPIPKFPSYAVSSNGRVVNLKTGKILKPQSSERGVGYLFVDLRGGGKRKIANIHTLVAEAFIGSRPEGKVVHHKNGNRRNPALKNLEYVTLAENARMRVKESIQ